MHTLDISGQTFGSLTVTGRSERISAAGALWECVCQCGGTTVTTGTKLRSGYTRSCGCLKREVCIELRTTHGRANKSPTYRSWKEMRQRCMNPNSDKFHWYGGRGIAVCPQWESFEQFLADMGERPAGMTLDRINNDGPYSPENCRWATQLEQTRKQEKNKLSEALAAQLRADRATGMTYAALGAKYGVSQTTAHKCAIGATWT